MKQKRPVDISALSKHDVAQMLDLAILKPEWSDKEQLAYAKETVEYKYAAYYVLPCWTELIVKTIGEEAKKNNTLIGTGISFPYGSATTTSKLLETEDQIKLGATVLDMVANPGLLKDKKYDQYQDECSRFVKLCHDNGLIAKIIIRVGLLTMDEIKTATELVSNAGAEYVKTATGAGPVGQPNFAQAKLILDTLDSLNSSTRLKVSGVVEPKVMGAYSFIRMGASLIGTRDAKLIVDSLDDVKTYLYP
jgi:deoxyribose-phosphate aldolase